MALKKKGLKKKAAKKAVKRPARKSVKKPAKKSVKRTPSKRPVKRKPAAGAKKPVLKKVKKSKKGEIGVITHYFPHVQAAVIKLRAPLGVGDTIKIKGHTTDLTQSVTSMQVDRVAVDSAKKGAEIGVRVDSRVRQHDQVFKA